MEGMIRETPSELSLGSVSYVPDWLRVYIVILSYPGS